MLVQTVPINDPANGCLTKNDLDKSAQCPGSSGCEIAQRSQQLDCKLDETNPNFCLYGVQCFCSKGREK